MSDPAPEPGSWVLTGAGAWGRPFCLAGGRHSYAALAEESCWSAWARLYSSEPHGFGQAANLAEAKAAADAWLLAHGVEVPDPVVVPERLTVELRNAEHTIGEQRKALGDAPARIAELEAELAALRAQGTAWLQTVQQFQAERDAARAELETAQQPARDAFDAAVAAHARVAELEAAVQEFATARADLALVDDILGRICGPTIPDDRRVRLGVLLARAPRWTCIGPPRPPRRPGWGVTP